LHLLKKGDAPNRDDIPAGLKKPEGLILLFFYPKRTTGSATLIATITDAT
jgi:hypothetical protein